MSLTHFGTLPVGAVNVGLGAAKLGLAAEIAKLGVQAFSLPAALIVQATLQATPLNLAGTLTAFTAHISAGLAAALSNPIGFAGASATISAQLAVNLGIVEAQIAILQTVTASIGAGFSAGGIAGWSYVGQAAGFGETLAEVTPGGFGNVAGQDDVQALIVATESFESWGTFSTSVNTGATSGQNLGATTTRKDLAFLGELTGGDWNTGVRRLKLRLDLLLAELEGLSVALQASIQLHLGLTLGGLDLQALLAPILDADIAALFTGAVSLSVDINAVIAAFDLRIAAVVELTAQLDAELSAGGLSVWGYSGPVAGLGASMAAALTDGLPGGNGPLTPAYGLALVCAVPSAWASFGLILGAG